MSFEPLGLQETLTRALAAASYTEPTTVQEQAIPAALAGKDLMVSSRTGSGKTAAFALALLAKLNPRWFAVQAMVAHMRPEQSAFSLTDLVVNLPKAVFTD